MTAPSTSHLAALTLASALLAWPGRARADGPPPSAFEDVAVPAGTDPGDPVLVFEKPRFWPTASSETWTLRDARDAVICKLPCASHVSADSRDVVEGVAHWPAVYPYDRNPSYTHEETVRSRVRLDEVASAGSTLVARMMPQKGNPDGAITLAAVGGAIATGGIALLAAGSAGEARARECSACEKSIDFADPLMVIAGGVLTGIGAIMALSGLAWGMASERPKLVIGGATPYASAPYLHLSLAPGGLTGTF